MSNFTAGYAAKPTIWSLVEVNTGLFCVSAPVLKPLIRKLMPGLLSPAYGTYTFHHHNSGVHITSTNKSCHSYVPDTVELESQSSAQSFQQ